MNVARSGRWTLLALLSLSAPVAAFDDLLSAAGAFPSGVDSPYLFDYTAPPDGFNAPDARRYGPSDGQLAQALANTSGVDTVTGIDFGKVTGVLTIGDPPRTLTLLFAEPGFADAAPDALMARGFEPTPVDDITVYARGEDYAIDLAAARDPDPLGSGMGKAQRLAFGPEHLLRSAGWPEMKTALAGLTSPSPEKSIWTAMINGLRTASGDEAHLDLASGWAVSAFFDPGPGLDLDLLLDPEALKAQIETPPSGTPIVFPYALFAVTQNAAQASTHIVLAFGDEPQARSAGDEIAKRLADYSPTPAPPRVTVAEVGPYFVTVLSLDVLAADAPQALDLFNRWMGGIYNRDFRPLMLP